MRFLYSVAAIARMVARSRRIDADLADELRFHLDRETEANLARGMTADEARRAAHLKVGSVDDAIETARDDRPGSRFRQMGRDMRFGFRLLAKSPVLGVAAITIIALGIGAVTAIFSVVYGVMLRPLAFHEPERLVNVWTTMPKLDILRGYPGAADATAWRADNRVFEDIALVRTTANLNLVGAGEPERIQGARFSPNVLSVLGVQPALGRGFLPGENQPGSDQVVLLSDGLFRRRFGGDRSIVGRSIQLNGLPHVVVGVMPPDFQYPTRDYQAWVPLVVSPGELARTENQNYIAVARLRAGATVAQAQADLDAIARRLAETYPASNRDHGILVEPMLDNAVRDVRAPLIALLAAAACLLLIAALNLSNLLGARASARQGEFAVRLALGASRGRLAAQSVAEVAPLLAIGGALGVGLALAGVRFFVAAAPPTMPRLESVSVSAPVILVALAVLVITGVVAAVLPALQAWRADFTSTTRERNRSATMGRGRADARRFGVAAQIAFAVPLLVGATLLVRSAINLSRVDIGFQPRNLATIHLAVSRTRYATDQEVAGYYDRLLNSVRAVPGVSEAGVVNRLPLVGNQTMSVQVEPTPGATLDIPAIDSRPASPKYFAAMGIPLRAGRTFDGRDDQTGRPVAIVDERLARTAWPGQNAVGKRVKRWDGVWCDVIGVVGHIHATSIATDPRPQIYWSHHQVTQDRMALVARTTRDPGAVIPSLVQAIHAVDAEQPLYDIRTMEDVIDRSVIDRRLTMSLVVAFGTIALLLAAVGVYGVVAYGVAQRSREFGIRLALGSSQRQIAGLVVGEGASMAAIGTIVGLAGALALSEVLGKLVFGVSARDAVSVASGALILLGVAVLASVLPARRASAVDPAVTLRAE